MVQQSASRPGQATLRGLATFILPAAAFLAIISLFMPVASAVSFSANYFSAEAGGEGGFLLLIMVVAIAASAVADIRKANWSRITAGVVGIVAGLIGMIDGFGTMGSVSGTRCASVGAGVVLYDSADSTSPASTELAQTAFPERTKVNTMISTRTARATRTRIAVSAAALAAGALMLTACSGSSDAASSQSPSSSQASSLDGAYISITEGARGGIAAIDGHKITYINVTAGDQQCQLTTKVLGDIKHGSIVKDGMTDKGQYQVLSTGTINDSRTSVLWDDVNGSDQTGTDSGSGSISMSNSMITLGYTFAYSIDQVQLIPADSDQAKALMAKDCSQHS
ncbi:hypothetical protein AB0465_14730 [Streptomyces griseoviridis]|uniref:hypothetical protein n=1 Tax=Streptomyces griseoviridis TaxID=45398 RepID=UPI00344B23D0